MRCQPCFYSAVMANSKLDYYLWEPCTFSYWNIKHTCSSCKSCSYNWLTVSVSLFIYLRILFVSSFTHVRSYNLWYMWRCLQFYEKKEKKLLAERKHHKLSLAWLRMFSLCLNSFVVTLPNQLHRMARTSLATNFATSQRNSAWNSQLRFEVHDLIENYVMNLPSS